MFLLPRLRDLFSRADRKILRARSNGLSKKAVFSRYGWAVAQMNLQPLRQNKQDMYVFRPDSCGTERGRSIKSHASSRGSQQLLAAGMERVSFVKDVAPGGRTML